jgi:glucosamine-6-phosphate deaminase
MIMQPLKKFKVEKLNVQILKNRMEMGWVAARETAKMMKKFLAGKPEISMIFAAAPSQNEFLAELIKQPDLDWTRVIAFHMDEYIGIPEGAPQRFGTFLKNAIFDQLPFRQTHFLNGSATNLQAEFDRYSALLKKHPVDITCMGIGENGHLAFNDPPVADFQDSALVKVVELDDICRQQQVNDGCFPAFDAVPTQAMTLTIPALLQARWISCVVPAKSKARAVKATLTDKISTDCPASILRTHDAANLYLDPDSASKLTF